MIIDKDDKYEWARVAIQNLVIVLFGMDIYIYRLNIGWTCGDLEKES